MNGTPGNIFAHLTATAVKFVGDEGDYIEEHGWVDPRWSRTELFTNRNYAEAIVNTSVNSMDLAEEVTDVLSDQLGSYTDNGDGTFYAEDAYVSPVDGKSYTYALHFTHKHRDSAGRWVEEPWHPREAGITL